MLILHVGYELLHRYSFNDGTAIDSVGGSAYAGSLIAGATVTGNQATFATNGPYVSLPSGVFGAYTAVSVEAWVTTGVNSNWTRIFQFGASSTSNSNSMTVCRCNDAATCSLGNIEFSWRRSDGTTSSYSTSIAFNGQTNLHLVMTVTEGHYARLYINGLLAGMIRVVVSPLPPANVFYVGNSLATGNQLIGSVDEIRLWGGALSAAEVASHYSQGPSKI